MSPRERPQLIVVAGPNGSGKSTLTHTLLAPTGILILDPDAIARELSPAAPEQMRLEAGRVALQRQRDYVASGTSFVVETTLSGHTAVRLMAAAHQYGFTVTLIYVSTDSAEINVGRIAERVSQGGHQVPKPDVYRRYTRSLRNLLPAIHLSDTALVFDNTGEAPELVLTIKAGVVGARAVTLPHWLTTALGSFLVE